MCQQRLIRGQEPLDVKPSVDKGVEAGIVPDEVTRARQSVADRLDNGDECRPEPRIVAGHAAKDHKSTQEVDRAQRRSLFHVPWFKRGTELQKCAHRTDHLSDLGQDLVLFADPLGNRRIVSLGQLTFQCRQCRHVVRHRRH